MGQHQAVRVNLFVNEVKHFSFGVVPVLTVVTAVESESQCAG